MNRRLIIRKFLNNKDKFISGEEIKKELNISRAMVSKIIGSLRGDGFIFESRNNKGYRLISLPEKPDGDLISELLEEKYKNSEIIIFDKINSTNTYAKAISSEKGTPYAVIANEQLSGRGRYSRNFYSPYGKGLYLTAVIRPLASLEQIPSITVLTAVFVTELLQELCGVNAGIKWINDIYIGSKKLCGILCEAGIVAETKSADYVAIGVGINLKGKADEMPKEIREIATSLENEGSYANVNILAARLLNRLYFMERTDINILMKEKIDIYRQRLFMLGKKINVLKANTEIPATALSVDETGCLEVRYENGETEFLNSGEISIRCR